MKWRGGIIDGRELLRLLDASIIELNKSYKQGLNLSGS